MAGTVSDMRVIVSAARAVARPAREPQRHCRGRRTSRPSRRELPVFRARGEDRIIGAGQLLLSPWSNSTHRAELQKVFVAGSVRGTGVGRSLIAALHDAARQAGRSLLVLNTRYGEPAEALCRRLGYREVGLVPGWTLGPAGESCTHVTLRQHLPA